MHLEQVMGIKEVGLIEEHGIANAIGMRVKEPRLPQTGELGPLGVSHALSGYSRGDHLSTRF